MFEKIGVYQTHLTQGKILAYPTETLWGLGADASNEKAVDEIYKLTDRPRTDPMSLLVRDIQMVKKYSLLSKEAEKALHIFWPGPVTFVLPLANKKFAYLSDGEGNLRMRCSPHPFVRALLWDYPQPITTSAASRHQEIPSISHHSLSWLPDEVEKVDWPDLAPSQGSSVVKIAGQCFDIIREGDVEVSLLKKILTDLCFLKEGGI